MPGRTWVGHGVIQIGVSFPKSCPFMKDCGPSRCSPVVSVGPQLGCANMLNGWSAECYRDAGLSQPPSHGAGAIYPTRTESVMPRYANWFRISGWMRAEATWRLKQRENGLSPSCISPNIVVSARTLTAHLGMLHTKNILSLLDFDATMTTPTEIPVTRTSRPTSHNAPELRSTNALEISIKIG